MGLPCKNFCSSSLYATMASSLYSNCVAAGPRGWGGAGFGPQHMGINDHTMMYPPHLAQATPEAPKLTVSLGSGDCTRRCLRKGGLGG